MEAWAYRKERERTGGAGGTVTAKGDDIGGNSKHNCQEDDDKGTEVHRGIS